MPIALTSGAAKPADPRILIEHNHLHRPGHQRVPPSAASAPNYLELDRA